MEFYGPEEVFEFLRPKVVGLPLVRIDGELDGAYLVPDDLGGIQHCFSPGVDNRKQFEDELVNRFGLTTHLADFSSSIEQLETPLLQGRQTFTKKWIGSKTKGDTLSLADWISQMDVPPEAELMLQMDVEGAEYEILNNAPQSLLQRFRIIVIE